MRLLNEKKVTTIAGTYLSLGEKVEEVSICCHSDTPVRFLSHLDLKRAHVLQGAVEVLRQTCNRSAGYAT